MGLSKKVKITYTIDSRSAVRGAEELAKATGKVESSAAKSTAKIREFERAIESSNRNSALVSKVLRDTSGASDGFSASLRGVVSSLGGPAGVVAAIGGAGLAISALNDKIDSLAQRSMDVSNVFANVPIPIEAARMSTRGLVTDFDLARLASDAVSLSVTESSKDFADLSEALQKLGARRGVGALKSIEDGLSAIGRGSTELLDNLGITLKAAQAQDEYAKVLGKTAKELTEVEKAEAFREIATRKIIEAARAVTIDTDGAAAAVRRFNVDLQNIEDRALGGSVATISLADGLRQIQKDAPINVNALKLYGAAAADLRMQLRDLGVDTSRIPDDINKLAIAAKNAAIDVKNFNFEEEQRQKALERTPAFKAEQARLAAEKESLEVAQARIIEIENEQAFLTANNNAIAQKAQLQIESLQLQALIVRATGDESRAREIERQAELAQLAELSRIANTGNRRSGGRRRDPLLKERLEFQRQLTEAINGERRREFSEAVTLQRGYLQDVKRFQDELAASRLPEIDRLKETNAELDRQAELQAAALQREIELADASGDPAEAFALEQQQFAMREEMLQRQLDLEKQVGERERIENDLAQVRHQQTISRIEEEARLREEAQARIAAAISSVSAAERGAFQLSSTIAGAAINGEERKKRVLDGIKAAGLYADGAVASAQSVIAFASGNVPQGIALAAAAANAIAQGTIVAAGNARGGRGGGGSAGSATQFGQGGSSPQRAEFSVERGAPLSIREGVEGNPNNTGGGQRGDRQRGGIVVNIGRFQQLGAVDDDTAVKIGDGIRRSAGLDNRQGRRRV